VYHDVAELRAHFEREEKLRNRQSYR
jgi:hypothetical protein